jgi:hypothetical protein
MLMVVCEDPPDPMLIVVNSGEVPIVRVAPVDWMVLAYRVPLTVAPPETTRALAVFEVFWVDPTVRVVLAPSVIVDDPATPMPPATTRAPELYPEDALVDPIVRDSVAPSVM